VCKAEQWRDFSIPPANPQHRYIVKNVDILILNDGLRFKSCTPFLCLAYSQHGLDSVAALGVGDGPVDLLEIIELDETVKGKLP
jgi:hypothetical protein